MTEKKGSIPMKPLERSFFERDTVVVARELLGQHLVMWHPAHKMHLVCRVVETEAYTQNDPSCHAYGGSKGRAKTLFKLPGLSYVYFIYGMYYCLNVVTEPEGTAGAVLFRAVEPLVVPNGMELKTHGPGRLCKALGITAKEHNEVDLTNHTSPLFLAEGPPVAMSHVVTTTRIGISKAQDFPWRFYIQDNPWVSVKAKDQSKASKR